MTDCEQAYRDLRAAVETLADEFEVIGAKTLRALLASSALTAVSKGCGHPNHGADDHDCTSFVTASEGATEHPDLTRLRERVARAVEHGYAEGDVNHYVQPIIGVMRLRIRDGVPYTVAEMGHAVERLTAACDAETAWLNTPLTATGVTSSDGDRGPSEEWGHAHADEPDAVCVTRTEALARACVEGWNSATGSDGKGLLMRRLVGPWEVVGDE